MKTVKCKCGNRISVLDLKGSLYTVHCNKCGLKVLNIFVDKGTLTGTEQIIDKERHDQGTEVPGFWGKDDNPRA